MEKLILEAAYKAWNEMAPLRAKRERYKRFTYGDQWSDYVMDNKVMITAAERARRHGRRPMTNNLLRRLVKSVIGRYRYQRRDSGGEPVGEQATIYKANNLDELDCRSLEEFLISGCAIQRIARERRLQGEQVWVDMVSPDRFFVNRMCDPRGTDVEMVGMLHDWSVAEAVIRLGGGDRRRSAHIRQVYEALLGGTAHPFISDLREGARNFVSAQGGRCRVIEVWTLEVMEQLRCHDTLKASYYTVPARRAAAVERLNAVRASRGEGQVNTRWESVPVWRCRWLAPDGSLLHTHTSQAADGSHPFKFRFYPMIDGEVHSLVEDVIDQQIYINELISLIDHVVSCAAKGVLLFPIDEKLQGMTWDEVADNWSAPDAIIPIRGRGTAHPQQIITNSSNLGAKELLETQMQMFEDISGITNALMGKSQGSQVGAEKYESQVKNAIIAIADILETFGNLVADRWKAI